MLAHDNYGAVQESGTAVEPVVGELPRQEAQVTAGTSSDEPVVGGDSTADSTPGVRKQLSANIAVTGRVKPEAVDRIIGDVPAKYQEHQRKGHEDMTKIKLDKMDEDSTNEVKSKMFNVK